MGASIYYVGPKGSREEFGELSFSGLHGQRALGHHRLLFNLEIVTNPRPNDVQRVRLVDVKGEVSVGRSPGTPLGFLVSGGRTAAGELYESRNSVSVTLYLEADTRQLKALDDLRNGKDLEFSLKLQPEIVCDGRITADQTIEVSRHLNQSDCIEIFRATGYADRELIEVPSPDAMENEQLQKAIEDLHTAANHLRTGHWRTAVGACRDSVEALGTALDDAEETKNANPPNVEMFRDLRLMSKAQRFRLLRRAFLALTAAAHHRDENGLSIEWTPTDARATVAITSAIVSLYCSDV